jgi:hypothetical protein
MKGLYLEDSTVDTDHLLCSGRSKCLLSTLSGANGHQASGLNHELRLGIGGAEGSRQSSALAGRAASGYIAAFDSR